MVLIRQGLLFGPGKREVWPPGVGGSLELGNRQVRQDRGFSSARSGQLQALQKGASFSNLLEIQIFEALKLKNSGRGVLTKCLRGSDGRFFLEIGRKKACCGRMAIFLVHMERSGNLLENSSRSLNCPGVGSRKKKVELLQIPQKHNMLCC